MKAKNRKEKSKVNRKHEKKNGWEKVEKSMKLEITQIRKER